MTAPSPSAEKHQIEVEVKSLLGDGDAADGFRDKLTDLSPTPELTETNSQLNHYFEGSLKLLPQLASHLEEHLPADQYERLHDLVKKAQSASVRTREADGTVLVVIKASIDDTTSENGISRLEFEEPVDLSLEDLDQLILDTGYEYQAKWSRHRELYTVPETDMSITLDRNAGYGFLAEFELMVPSADEVAAARERIDAVMQQLDVAELEQDRLQRMFEHYNEHWREYYGTDKTFAIE